MTLPSPLNTVLILPDGDEKIMRGMFERFDEVAKAGGILVETSAAASAEQHARV